MLVNLGFLGGAVTTENGGRELVSFQRGAVLCKYACTHIGGGKVEKYKKIYVRRQM